MRTHLRNLNPAYPVCGSAPVPASYIVPIERYLRQPLLERCQRCARSLAGKDLIRRMAKADIHIQEVCA